MITKIEETIYQDPEAKRIKAVGWHDLFKRIPAVFVEHYRYYRYAGRTDWNTYLFPPTSFLIYGSRYLRKLQFDNSLTCLRLWGFMLSESERLFRARQIGKKIVATMGDLGSIPPLVYSFYETIPFYPDCYWWTPFLNESTVLFEEAKKLGVGDECCFVRAALGAFSKLAYFPQPDLGIAATGASCDDMSAVMQQIANLGHRLHWFEIPHRKDEIEKDQSELKEFIVAEYQNLIPQLEQISGQNYEDKNLLKTLLKINLLRKNIEEIKHLTFSANKSPLPALEIMNIEFMALSAYSDLEEAVSISNHLLQTVRTRIKNNEGLTDRNAVRIAWVTPPADPLLLNYLEDLGGRLVATEFVINQALHPLAVQENPLKSLAEGMARGSLMGTSKSRAESIIRRAKKYHAEGVIISNIFASSHCAYETSIIKEQIRKRLNIPVLIFDVVAPGKKILQSQILNRMSAFMEMVKERRRNGHGPKSDSA